MVDRFRSQTPEAIQWRKEFAIANNRIEGIERDPDIARFMDSPEIEALPHEEQIERLVEFVHVLFDVRRAEKKGLEQHPDYARFLDSPEIEALSEEEKIERLIEFAKARAEKERTETKQVPIVA